jgi:uncharacterized membrane protein
LGQCLILPEADPVDRSRLEAFSDGVFAVAITLLVLDLAVDGPDAQPHRSLLFQLGHLWPSFLAYLVSFFMIGIIWVNHHVLVRSIREVDRTLLFLNQVMLLFVVLIPFATATMADYRLGSDRDSKVSMVLYGLVFLGMSVGFGAVFEWTLHGERRHQPLPPQAHWPARIRFLAGGLAYVTAIVVALFSAVASFVIIALVAVYYIVERTPGAPAGPGSPGAPEDAPGSFPD